MLWADTANDLLKQRNAADSAWISILTLSTGAPLGTLSSSLLSGALPAIDGSALTGLASANQAQVQTHLTTTSSQAVTVATITNITGLSATITPTTTSKRIKVTVRWSGEFSSLNQYDTTYGIKRGTTVVGSPAAVGSRNVGIATVYIGFHQDTGTTPDSAFYSYIDSPATTSATTYYATFKHATISGTLYNQRTTADANASNNERLTSSITLEEID
jgi:hypothetical protein